MLHLLLTPLGLTAPPRARAAPTIPCRSELLSQKKEGRIHLWDSAQPRARPTATWELKLFFSAQDDMQAQLGLRGQRDQDDAFGLIAAISVAGVVGASVVGASDYPPVVKLPLTAVCAISPYLAITAGVAIPKQLTALRRLNPEYRRRQNVHEAGHFLVGYVLGLEIESFNLATSNGDTAQVEFANPLRTKPQTHDVLDRLAVLSMAGIAAEILEFGNAEGGLNDVSQVKHYSLFHWKAPSLPHATLDALPLRMI